MSRQVRGPGLHENLLYLLLFLFPSFRFPVHLWMRDHLEARLPLLRA